MPVVVKNEITALCECGKTKHAISWVQQEVEQGGEMPDLFFRGLKVERFYVEPDAKHPGPYIFLSPVCLIRWLEENYRPSRSPKQQTPQAEPAADIPEVLPGPAQLELPFAEEERSNLIQFPEPHETTHEITPEGAA